MRMMLSRGTVSSRKAFQRGAGQQADRDDDHQNREAGFPVGVNKTHRQQGRRERAERAQADDVSQECRDQCGERQQQQDLHDLVHFERQPLQVEHLRRVAQFGVDQSHIGRQAFDRIADRQLGAVDVGCAEDLIGVAADRDVVHRHVQRVAVRRIERLPLLVLENFEPDVRLQFGALADDEAGDQSRREAERTAEGDHRSGSRFRRAVLGDDRDFGVIGQFGAAGIDVGAVFEDPLQAFEFGLRVVRSELGRLTDDGVGRRQINFRPEEPVARGQRFERRPIACRDAG